MKTRYPRAIAVINSTFAVPVSEMDIDLNSFYEADSFYLKAPIKGLPAKYGASWFSEQETLDVELYLGNLSDNVAYTISDLDRQLVGNADRIEVDFRKQSIVISGRDLTGALIDAPVSQTWQNQTATEIAKEIAKQHGLTANVASGADKRGIFMGSNWNRLSNTSAWDILTYLANETQTGGKSWVCYVSGRELYFGPRPESDVFTVQWPDVEELRCRRHMLVSRDITVQFKSWNQQTGLVVATANSSGHKGTGQTYVYVQPNLTHEQALKKAQAQLAKLASHELTADGTIPGDAALKMQSKVRIQGTNTAFDADLYPVSVSHRFSRNGFTTHFRAKSHAPTTIIT